MIAEVRMGKKWSRARLTYMKCHTGNMERGHDTCRLIRKCMNQQRNLEKGIGERYKVEDIVINIKQPFCLTYFRVQLNCRI